MVGFKQFMLIVKFEFNDKFKPVRLRFPECTVVAIFRCSNETSKTIALRKVTEAEPVCSFAKVKCKKKKRKTAKTFC